VERGVAVAEDDASSVHLGEEGDELGGDLAGALSAPTLFHPVDFALIHRRG
jgi:hypothetical protein